MCGAQQTMGERIKTITHPGRPNQTENFYGVGKRVLRQVAYDGIETRFAYKLAGACVTKPRGARIAIVMRETHVS